MNTDIKNFILKICLLYLAVVAHAAASDAHSWDYVIRPYLWNASFDGSTSSGGAELPVDANYEFFTLDNLDNVFSLDFEARKGRSGILLDGLTAKYSDSISTRVLSAELAVELGFVEVAYSYMPEGYVHLDFIGGARYVFLETHRKFRIAGEISTDDTWLDPIVGARYKQNWPNNVYVMVRGDVGGFGVSSDMMINLSSVVGYSINKTISLDLGYRFVSIDFKEDDFLYDISMQGVTIGLAARF